MTDLAGAIGMLGIVLAAAVPYAVGYYMGRQDERARWERWR